MVSTQISRNLTTHTCGDFSVPAHNHVLKARRVNCDCQPGAPRCLSKLHNLRRPRMIMQFRKANRRSLTHDLCSWARRFEPDPIDEFSSDIPWSLASSEQSERGMVVECRVIHHDKRSSHHSCLAKGLETGFVLPHSTSGVHCTGGDTRISVRCDHPHPERFSNHRRVKSDARTSRLPAVLLSNVLRGCMQSPVAPVPRRVY